MHLKSPTHSYPPPPSHPTHIFSDFKTNKHEILDCLSNFIENLYISGAPPTRPTPSPFFWMNTLITMKNYICHQQFIFNVKRKQRGAFCLGGILSGRHFVLGCKNGGGGHLVGGGAFSPGGGGWFIAINFCWTLLQTRQEPKQICLSQINYTQVDLKH